MVSRHSPLDSKKNDEYRIPAPSHRHAAPSAPWPWVDLEDAVDKKQLESGLPPIPPLCDHVACGGCWRDYPKSRFPNWTDGQVEKAKIAKAIKEYRKDINCIIHHVDVDDNGFFTNAEELVAHENNKKNTWDLIVQNKRPERSRVRALFVENMSGPVLQMLGARFNIEPFFFSSSLNWIPSRYQEEVRTNKGDHITISLTFLRSTQESRTDSHNSSTLTVGSEAQRSFLINQMIDTRAPLLLRNNNNEDDNHLLVLDLLSVHLIRDVAGSTIISLHPDEKFRTTTASYLHERIRFAGQSVYWQTIFQRSPDPTFVLLTFIWHALYAWDEALENLYAHICWLETLVLDTSDMGLTRELHIIRAHHLHYSSLLEDFRKTVEFVQKTRNPALDALSEEDRKFSESLMTRECDNLISEIDRLEMGRRMQDKRLKNVMNLVFSSVNIGDSKRMQRMTEAAVRDSAGKLSCILRMKQIAYLTMIFLPGSFVAAVFGMNIKEIAPGTNGTLPNYLGTAITMTAVTAWIIIAFQSRYLFEEETPLWKRLGWPLLLIMNFFRKKTRPEGDREKKWDVYDITGSPRDQPYL